MATGPNAENISRMRASETVNLGTGCDEMLGACPCVAPVLVEDDGPAPAPASAPAPVVADAVDDAPVADDEEEDDDEVEEVEDDKKDEPSSVLTADTPDRDDDDDDDMASIAVEVMPRGRGVTARSAPSSVPLPTREGDEAP